MHTNSLAHVFCGLLLACGLAAGFGGCSRSPGRLDVATYEVRGRVLINGQPASGASIVLLPVEEADNDPKTPANLLIGGIADENGEFRVITEGIKPGAPAGSYLVGVSWPDPKVEPDRDGGERGADLVPPKYRDPRKSGIEFEVHPDAGESNELLIDVKS
jgi:hypothetical protein